MGVVSIAIGVLSVYGNMTTRSNMSYQYTRTAGVQDGSKRVQEDINLTNQSLGFFQYMFISGIISTIVGGIMV